MASCIQTLAGLCPDCSTSKGGIVEVFITADYDNVGAYLEEESGVTAETLSITGTSKWYKYSFKRNTGSMTSTLNRDDAAGSNYVTTEVVLQFNRQDTAKRIEMSALALNEMAVIVKDANGKYWFLGLNEPVVASAGTAQTGQNRGDGNFYQITLQANDDTFPYEVDANDVPSPEGPSCD